MARRQEPEAPALTELIWSAERSPVIFRLENEQRELLAACGCDLMQGFLFHPPLPADELRAALARTPPAGVRSPG